MHDYSSSAAHSNARFCRGPELPILLFSCPARAVGTSQSASWRQGRIPFWKVFSRPGYGARRLPVAGSGRRRRQSRRIRGRSSQTCGLLEQTVALAPAHRVGKTRPGAGQDYGPPPMSSHAPHGHGAPSSGQITSPQLRPPGRGCSHKTIGSVLARWCQRRPPAITGKTDSTSGCREQLKRRSCPSCAGNRAFDQ